MVVDNSNVSNETQSVIYNILSSDSTLTALTTNIFDGNPERVVREHGFPMVIINSPEYETRLLTMTKWENNIICGLEVYSKQESNVRRVFDAMVNAIKNGLGELHAGGLWQPRFTGTSLLKTDNPSDGGTLYILSTTLELYDMSA